MYTVDPVQVSHVKLTSANSVIHEMFLKFGTLLVTNARYIGVCRF